MNLDNELKLQNPFKKEQHGGGFINSNLNSGNNNNGLQTNFNPSYQQEDETHLYQHEGGDQYSGYNEASNADQHNRMFNNEQDMQGFHNMETNLEYINQHLVDYQPGMLDDQDGIHNYFQSAMIGADEQNNIRDLKAIYKNEKSDDDEDDDGDQIEQQLRNYEKVSEYILQAQNHLLNGMRNTLTYQQNRNFLYQEQRCLMILQENNQIFNFEAYKSTMIMCGILLDASIDLIKEKRYYLAEKYLMRAKSLTEPNEKHLNKRKNYKKSSMKEIEEKNQNEEQSKNLNNEDLSNSEDDSQHNNNEDEEGENDGEEFIFEKDIRYHDIRIEIALNLCDLYKQQMKNIKKKRKNQLKKKAIQFSSNGQTIDGIQRKYDQANNDLGAMKEIKEEHELEQEHEKNDHNRFINPSLANLQLSNQQSPTKEKQVFFATPSNISAASIPKNNKTTLTKKESIQDDEEKKQDFWNKSQKEAQQIQYQQKKKEIDEEEEKDEEEKQNENKMENALTVLNEIQAKLTEEYISLSKQDLKGTLCKFYSKKVEVIYKLLQYDEEAYDEEIVEEMQQEMLECAKIVTETLESILLPLKASDSSQSQEDSVYLATILSYTWIRLGKFRLKTKEIDKAIQCYKNAYERIQNFFKEGNDRIFLQEKFKNKYDKLMGKLAFEKLGDGDIIEFSQFEDEYNFQTHQEKMQANKKNYLSTRHGLSMTNIQINSGQLYVDPQYLNQLQSHHTVKSLNKNRYLKKIPITHPFGSSISVFTQTPAPAQPTNPQNQPNLGRTFKFKKNLQIQLENYKNQIIGNTQNNLTLQPQNINAIIEQLSMQKPADAVQLKLQPDEMNAPFIVPTQKVRQHPQSAKVRGTSTSRRHFSVQGQQLGPGVDDSNSNLGQQDQQYFSQAKQGIHKKAPSLTNAPTKLSSATTRNFYEEKPTNQEGGFGNLLSYTSVSSSRREYQLNNKFIQDESQSQNPQSGQNRQKNLYTPQGYYQHKKQDSDLNSQQFSIETLKQGQTGIRKGGSLSQLSMQKSLSNAKQQSLHQFPAQIQNGANSTKRITSAKPSSQTQIPQKGDTTRGTDVQEGMYQSMKGIESQTSRRNPPEGAKSAKFFSTRNNSTTNDMFDNIANFVDQMYDGSATKNSILNSNKSTVSTSNRNQAKSKRPSSSIIYFSTNRLFNNSGTTQQIQNQQEAQQSDQQGIIYEKYEGNDLSQQNIQDQQKQDRFIEPSSRDSYYAQQPKQVIQIKKPLDGNRFLVINTKPSSTVNKTDKLFSEMGNIRVQLNNLFEQTNDIKVYANIPSAQTSKYSIKLNASQNVTFMNLINNRPPSKQELANTQKTRLSSRKSSQAQTFGQNGNDNDFNQMVEEEYYSQNPKLKKSQQNMKFNPSKQSIQNPQSQKQFKSMQQFEDKRSSQLIKQNQGGPQERKSEGSQRRLNTIEKQGGKNKDMTSSQQQQYNNQMQQQNGMNAAGGQNNTNLNQSINNQQQYIMNSQSQKNNPQNGSPKGKDKEIQIETNRNIQLNNISMLKKRNTETYHDTSMISGPLPALQPNQVSNQDMSKMLKSSKQQEQIISNKSGQINNSKIEDKSVAKPALRRLSTNVTDSAFKRQPTANYDQVQIDIQPIQSNNEEDRKFNSHFATSLIKQKFDQFENMNNDRMKKDQNKINETQSSQEDDEDENDGEDRDISDDEQRNYPNQMLDDLQNGEDQRGGEDNVIGDDLKKSDKRLGNSMNLKISQGKLAQQSPEISRLMASQQQGQDHNKSHQQYLTDQGFIGQSLQQSFLNQQHQTNVQSNLGLHDKSLMMNSSQNIAHALLGSNTKGMNISQNLKQQLPFNNQNKDQIPVKTLHFPSVKQSKYLFVQNRIQELLFVPLYFYKSFNSYSLCQWNVTNISIELENVSVEEDAEDIEKIMKENTKNNLLNKGGLPCTSDKIRYDIKLCIFLECVITDQHIINNPLIFYLKNQPLNFIDHLWPNDKNKIETKYELAILLLDRWIQERDVDVVEEFYNKGLTEQNIEVQFVLRGGNNFSEFQKLISSESSQIVQKGEKFDQIKLFGLKLNFVINKIAQVVKKVHGDILQLPGDLNDISNSQMSIRQNNLKSLRRHQNKRRELRNVISYFLLEKVNLQQIKEIENYKRRRVEKPDQRNEVIPSTLRERTQIQLEENIVKSTSNGGEMFYNDDNLNQRLNLSKGYSNESPVYYKNVDFSEFSEIQARKRFSTRDYNQSNQSNNNKNQNQQQIILTNSSNAQSPVLTSMPFFSPQMHATHSFQLQLQQGGATTSNTPVFAGRLQQRKANILSPQFQIGQPGASKFQQNPNSNDLKSQKFHYLKYKMRERLYQIQKDSESSIPLETQVNPDMLNNPNYTSDYPEGTQESVVQSNVSGINSAPFQTTQNGKFETEQSSSRQNQQNSRIIPTLTMQGYSSTLEDQQQSTSPIYNLQQQTSSATQGFSEEVNLQLQKDSQSMAEEYKKKYEIALSSAVTNPPGNQAMNIHSLTIHSISNTNNNNNRQNSLRIEHLKRQVRDNLQNQQNNTSNNINDQSQSYSESPRSFPGNNSQNNSFASSYNSSATSPTNQVGTNTLQRMPSLLSNKSSKSKFSRYAPTNNDELNDESMQSPSQAQIQNKKSSQFARQNVKMDHLDEDGSYKSPLPMQPESESLEYFPPTNEDILAASSYKLTFNDQFINQKSDKPEIVIKDYQITEDRSEEGLDEDAAEHELFLQKKHLNDDQCGDPFIDFPEFFKYETYNLNPFMNNDLLLKTVIKRDKLFFFVQLFFSFDAALEQYIFYDQALTQSWFILKADSMIYKSGWKSEIILTFEQVVEKLIKPYTSFSFFKFLYTKGFTSKQKESIKKGLEKYLKVKDCQFIINWDVAQDQTALNKSGELESSNIKKTHEDQDLITIQEPISQFEGGTTDYPEDDDQNMDATEKKDEKQNEKIKKKKLQFSKSTREESPQQKQEYISKEVSFYQQQKAKINELHLIIDKTQKQQQLYKPITTVSSHNLNQYNTTQNSFYQNQTTYPQINETIQNSTGGKILKQNEPRLPILVQDTSIFEYKSNLDVKMLALSGLSKLSNYETPAREEDYKESFTLLCRNDIVIALKYIEREQKNYHKLLIYKPLSNFPLRTIEIMDINILERFLNIKWLDAQIITLLKKQNGQTRRKLLQPHINQGLTQVDSLKNIIFSSFFQEKLQMNGQKINLRPIFSIENQRIKHNVFTSRNLRLQCANSLLLENIKKKHSYSNYADAMEDTIDVSSRQAEFKVRDFLHLMKYAIVSYDINDEWQFQQNEIVQKYFEKKTIKDYAYINSHSQQNKFKVFMIFSIFRAQIHLNLEKLVYLRLDIVPLEGQRNKQFKLIFELSDIVNLFERSYTFDNSFDEIVLFKIIQKVSKSLVYSKGQVYKQFSLPLSKINPQQVDRHQFCLINRFTIKPPCHLTPKEIDKRSFLDLIQSGERVLYQGVKKLLNTYAIITIGYYSQLDYYYLQIYLPFNCRRFTNTFYSSNLASLSGEFMNNIFKETIARNNIDELAKIKDYSQFYRRLTKLDPTKLQSNRNSLKNEKTTNRLGVYSIQHLGGAQNYLNPAKSQTSVVQIPIEEQMESSVEQKQIPTFYYINPKLFLDLIKPSAKQNTLGSMNFIELTIWDEIVKNIEVSIDNNGEMLLTMDNYSGIMREYLIKSILNFSGNKNGLFEVLVRFKDQKTKSDIYSSPQIQINESNEELKLDMYVRINFFQKVNSINEKILMRQILFSYYNENRIKFRNIPKEQHPHNLLNLVGFNSNENLNQGQESGRGYRHSLPQENYTSQHQQGPNLHPEEQIQYLQFSECTFDHSDLIKVSYLLLDRIRTSIQEKQMQIMKFYDHQNEIFETGKVVDNLDVDESLPIPPVQQQVSQSVASAYLNMKELPQDKSILKKKQVQTSMKNLEINDKPQNLDQKNNALSAISSWHTLEQLAITSTKQLEQNSQMALEDKSRLQNECFVDRKVRKKIKMNNNININELLDSENRQLYMKTLFRGVFTVRPLQIIAIFFYKKFYVQIYNTINGKNLITDLSFATVEHQIPYLSQMLKLELYQEIGKRIFLSFKNRLMIKSYPELIDY